MTIVAISGCSGGLGVSSLVCALGVVAARSGLVAAVVDAVPFAGGIQVTAGVEHEPGYRWPDLAEVEGALDGERLLGQLPSVDGCAVLSAGFAVDAPNGSVREAIPRAAYTSVCQALSAACDLVVLDSGTGGGPGSVGTQIVLAGLSARGLADAQARMQIPDTEPIGGLITRSRRRDEAAAMAFATHLGVPLLDQLLEDRSVSRSAAQGLPPGGSKRSPIARLARRLVEAVAAPVEDSAPPARGRSVARVRR